MCDLGENINLMPLSLYLNLGLGSLKRTTLIFQPTDRSIAKPERVLEDVLVQVASLIFIIDFVVLEFEPIQKFHSFLNVPSWPRAGH